MSGQEKKFYWFKRRLYGYGWMPVSWQGWAATIIWITLIVVVNLFWPSSKSSGFLDFESIRYWLILILSTLIFSTITLLKGPKPKWRWGVKPTDNPDEDFMI